jgi:hypothetical protein
MNPAVAYIVLASGTGKDQAQTFWGIHAIEKYTSISRLRARRAVDLLIEKALVTPSAVNGRPGYRLLPPSQDARPPLSEWERKAVDAVRAGKPIRNASLRGDANNAAAKGWLVAQATGAYTLADPPPTVPRPPSYIWLPNTLVTGAISETPPLERVRQTQDVMALRLFVDLYAEGHPRVDGGVSRATVRRVFERHRVGEQGPFVVWGFRRSLMWVTWRGAALCHRDDDAPETDKRGGLFFRRIGQLRDVGALEWVPHLVEAEDEDAEIVHPFGLGRSDSIEDRLGQAAHAAAAALLTPEQRAWSAREGYRLVPVPSTWRGSIW